MIAGFYFYWTSWLLWIIIVFFMEKNQIRTWLAVWILTLMMFFPINISVHGYTISVSFLILLIVALFLHAQLSKPYYHLLLTFIVTIGYTGVIFWLTITPVWIIIPTFLLIPLICTALVFMLIKSFPAKLIISMVGVTCGELLHSLISFSYYLHDYIGDYRFFDYLSLIILFICLFHFLQIVYEIGLAKIQSLFNLIVSSCLRKNNIK